ncbi:holin [uncultured Mobiluncus sp.]|uniref:holin n=1 Tax=uncultured Mobiluncus sp. TaxID=293425 RepID=UPI00261DFB4F|nr:holin [uncultured Mobiluncus sp.]
MNSVKIWMTQDFWLGVLERGVKTFAQAMIAAIGTTAALNQVDWQVVLLTAGLAALLSVLTSLATPETVFVKSRITVPGTAQSDGEETPTDVDVPFYVPRHVAKTIQ